MTNNTDPQLTDSDIQSVQYILQDYKSEPSEIASPENVAFIKEALSTLENKEGNIEASFEELWAEQVGPPQQFAGPSGKSLWQVTLEVVRKEICGDDGFRSKVLDYNKNPASAASLTGLIVYLVSLTTLPINPAIATIIVLYILKVGLNIFCEYTEPKTAEATEL